MEKLLKFTLYIFVVLTLIYANVYVCMAGDGLYLHKEDRFYSDMAYYSVPIEKFDSFVKNPNTISEYATKYSYFVVPSEEYQFGIIKRDIHSLYINDVYDGGENSTVVYWNFETEASYYNLMVEDTFKYMKKENISNVLKSKRIYDNIKDISLVCVGGFDYCSIYPATIWITTENNNNYYLVFQGDYDENSVFDVEAMKFMTYKEYNDKYSIKYGDLYINNKKVSMDSNIMFQCERYLYIPFRDVLESLGSEVEWNSELRCVNFTCGENVYTLYNDLISLQRNMQNVGVMQTYNTVPFVDGKMYIGKGILSDIAELFNMNCQVDFEKNIVHLNTITED